MRILTLNCQRGYQPGLQEFLHKILVSGTYDFILLQEFAKSVPGYVRGIGPYDLLEAHHDEAGEQSQLCIVYRNAFELLESDFASFATMRKDPFRGFKHPSFALLQGRFQCQGKAVLAGSLHMHSGINAVARVAELKRAKEKIVKLARPDDTVVFGGDCNFGFPGERVYASRLLSPQFVCATRGIGGTIDSRYVENVAHLPNRVAALLTKLGLSISLSMDHLFVDEKTAKENKITCRVLPDRVSDHSPVELILV